MEEIVYFNGSLIPLSEAKVSAFDWGFLYGYGLFETMRAYNGRIFLLERHLRRLANSADLLGIELPDNTDLEKALYEILKAKDLSDARIRLTVSGGEGEPVPNPINHSSPTLLITAREYTPYSEDVYEKGFKAVVSQIRRNTLSPISMIKSLNYLDNLMAHRSAKLVGADQAILLNERGFLAEGSTSNLFLISGNTLLTPGENSGILSGVTRGLVLDLASTLGMEVEERGLPLEKLVQAEEAFLTNSIVEIMPLTQVDWKKIGSGKPGPWTQWLMSAYKQLIERFSRQ